MSKYIPWLVCFLLGIFCLAGIEKYKSINLKYESAKEEYENLISEMESENDSYKSEISVYEIKVDSLQDQIENRTERIKKLSKEISNIKPINDTIRISVPLYIENKNQTDSILRDFRKISDLKDSIIFRKDCIIQNDSLEISALKIQIKEKIEENSELQKQIIRESKRKIFWQTTAGVTTGIAIIAIVI